MVYIDKGALVLRLQSEDPENLLTEIRNALTAVTSVLVESDEFNYYPAIPDALGTLIRLNGELVKED